MRGKHQHICKTALVLSETLFGDVTIGNDHRLKAGETSGSSGDSDKSPPTTNFRHNPGLSTPPKKGHPFAPGGDPGD